MSTFEIIARQVIVQASLQNYGVTSEHVLTWLISRYLDIIGTMPFGEATRQVATAANTVAPYRVGTVNATQGATTVVGTGTTFTPTMTGSYIRINNLNVWHRVTFVNTAQLILDAPYSGVSVTNSTYIIANPYAVCPGDVRWFTQLRVPEIENILEVNIENLNAMYPARSYDPGMPIYWARSHFTPAPFRRVVELYPAPDRIYRVEFTGYAGIDEPTLQSSALAGIEDQVLISGGLADAFNFKAGKLIDENKDVTAVRSSLDVAARHEKLYSDRKEQLRSRDQKDMAQPRVTIGYRYPRSSFRSQSYSNVVPGISSHICDVPVLPVPTYTGIVNILDHGGVASLTADNKNAIAEAIDATPNGGVLFFPPGSYPTSDPVELNKQIEIRGTNKIVTEIIQMTPDVPAMKISGGFGSVKNIGLRRTIKPIIGGDGIVLAPTTSHIMVTNVRVTKHYRGVVLRTTDLGYFTNVDVSGCESAGWAGEYRSDSVAPGTLQWWLTKCSSSFNLQDGFHFINDDAANAIGPWFVNCITFANAHAGYHFAGAIDHALNDVFVLDCLASSDGLGGIIMDGTFGEGHAIRGCWIELVGLTSALPLGFDETPSVASLQGHGLQITGDHKGGGINIVGGGIWHCAWAGVYLQGTEKVAIRGMDISNNGLALEVGIDLRAGLSSIDCEEIAVSGCKFTKNPATPGQEKAIVLGGDATTVNIDSSNSYPGYGYDPLAYVDTTLTTVVPTQPSMAPMGLTIATGRAPLQLVDENNNTRKYFKVNNGVLEFRNSSFAPVITWTDAGDMTTGRHYVGYNSTPWTGVEFVLSAGWGNTATITAVEATDSGGNFQVTSGGSGQGAGPTITITFKDGAWGTVPKVITVLGPSAQLDHVTSSPIGMTGFIVQFAGTPSGVQVFNFTFHVKG